MIPLFIPLTLGGPRVCEPSLSARWNGLTQFDLKLIRLVQTVIGVNIGLAYQNGAQEGTNLVGLIPKLDAGRHS